jgi:hypothetical protein
MVSPGFRGSVFLRHQLESASPSEHHAVNIVLSDSATDKVSLRG